MRERRFCVTTLDHATLSLTGGERHHAVDVLRLAVGAEVTLFDGQGREARARIVAIDEDRVDLALIESPRDAGHSARSLTLVVAAPKGGRADWLVEKCGELGVARLVFVESQRGEVHPGEGKLERWRRKAVEAAKQSGAAVVTQIDAGRTLESLAGELLPTATGYVGATTGEATLFVDAMVNAAGACVCFVGPEGGFTEQEIERLIAHGARPVSLGPSTLRVETAAIAMAAIWGACGVANAG